MDKGLALSCRMNGIPLDSDTCAIFVEDDNLLDLAQ